LEAYVLIQTQAHTGRIAERVRGLKGVISAEDLTGAFDAIAVAESGSTGSLADSVLAEIRRMPGVIRVLSAPLVRSAAGVRELQPVWSDVA